MPYSSFFPAWFLETIFLRRITIAFLTGYSLALLVGLLVVPVSCRLIAFKEITGFLQLTRKSLKQQASYMHKLKTLGVLDDHASVANSVHSSSSNDVPQGSLFAEDVWSNSDILKTLAQLGTLHSKLGPDVLYAQREVAFGCITAADLEKMCERIQELYVMVRGMGNILTMLRRLVRLEGREAAVLHESSTEKNPKEEQNEIADAMKILDTTFTEFVDILDGAIEHALLLLELNDPSRKERLSIKKQFSANASNLEANGEESSPGQPQYLDVLERRVSAFQKLRLTSLEAWKASTDIDQSQMTFNFASQFPTVHSADDKTPPTRSQQELLLLLWVSLPPRRDVL